ncbi:MAG: TIGR04372 family glycosyltransferase [Betaproteobacteria bacterium]|nr:TIGR04372 family glycosyltransferase [Betaproteobacteria bacterium]
MNAERLPHAAHLVHRYAPLLRIDERDARRGEAALRSLGIQPGQWYVCVHSREPGYSPGDDGAHSYRNSSFDDYLLAVEYIVSCGGFCIRMGDASAAAVPAMPGLVDYARHPLRSDWLDLYLAATCRFFLGNSSGAFAMASVFGVPVACANMAPLSVVYPNGPSDIGIPKLYRERATGRLLTFPEILALPMANWRFAGDFDSAGIELINNTPEEIRELAEEQYRRVTMPSFKYDPSDEELQMRFRKLFRPGHYMYGSASRIGQSFLRRHADLLR